MVCMQQALQQTLDYGYAHHIQRLMVLGLYATLAEVTPSQVSDWFHAIYVDAVDWVQRPNVLGMALCATGGSMTSKPYIASGAYIDKMSNYCSYCRYQPKEKLGVNACPFTLLYWRFILRHEAVLSSNPRTKLMVTHVAKLSAEQRASILSASDRWLTHHGRPV